MKGVKGGFMGDTQEKMIIDTLKPRAEMSELEAPPDFVQQYLEEDINIWKTLAEMLKMEGVDTIFGILAGSSAGFRTHMETIFSSLNALLESVVFIMLLYSNRFSGL